MRDGVGSVQDPQDGEVQGDLVQPVAGSAIASVSLVLFRLWWPEGALGGLLSTELLQGAGDSGQVCLKLSDFVLHRRRVHDRSDPKPSCGTGYTA